MVNLRVDKLCMTPMSSAMAVTASISPEIPGDFLGVVFTDHPKNVGKSTYAKTIHEPRISASNVKTMKIHFFLYFPSLYSLNTRSAI